ncbi:MAG: hypothetical protein AAGI52_07150 [Bacteroidota bacterium]
MVRLLLAAMLAAPPAFAQSSFALSGFPVSAHEVGVSQALAAGPSDNPYAIRHNPALLADAGERPALRFSAGLAPDFVGVDDLLLGSSAASIGIDAGEVGGGSLRIGLGGSYTELRSTLRLIGPSIGEIEYDTQEREITGGLALGWDGPVHVRFGANADVRESFAIPPDLSLPEDLERDRTTTLDVGAAVSYPLLTGPSGDGEIAPEVEITGAAVLRNLAVLSEDFSARPANGVRGANTFGVSVRAAHVRQLGRRGRFHLVEGDVRAEPFNGSDIRAGEARLAGTVILAEILAVRAGYAAPESRGSDPFVSLGAELRIDGVVRAVGAQQKSASMLALADRLTTRFEVAVLRVGETIGETTVYGVTFGWRP